MEKHPDKTCIGMKIKLN